MHLANARRPSHATVVEPSTKSQPEPTKEAKPPKAEEPETQAPQMQPDNEDSVGYLDIDNSMSVHVPATPQVGSQRFDSFLMLKEWL
jgi:hypothetical protein